MTVGLYSGVYIRHPPPASSRPRAPTWHLLHRSCTLCVAVIAPPRLEGGRKPDLYCACDT
eukprot:scaffold108950_cov32-Tisochrysis_lutea.AAC.2